VWLPDTSSSSLGGLGHGCPTTDPSVIGAGNIGDEEHMGCGVGRTPRSVLRASCHRPSTGGSEPQAHPLLSRDKNIVRLNGLICVAPITLDDKETGNHTLVATRMMRAMGPSWL
jgi:hypothetical protein